jgi:hypothetical protein
LKGRGLVDVGAGWPPANERQNRGAQHESKRSDIHAQIPP